MAARAARLLRAGSSRLVAGGGALLGGGWMACEAMRPSEERKAEGGVLGEYKDEPRRVLHLERPLQGFFSKEMRVLQIPLRAHACVSDAALLVAADRLSRMLRNLPKPVLDRLERRGAAFHVIGVCQGTSDLPEHQHMRGVPGGYTGEGDITLDQRARGMGGTQASCGEENLVDLDSDPRYRGRDILVHEFAHCLMDVGLPKSARRQIVETFERAVHEKGCAPPPLPEAASR